MEIGSRPWQIMFKFCLLFFFPYCPIFYLFFFSVYQYTHFNFFQCTYISQTFILAEKHVFMTKVGYNPPKRTPAKYYRAVGAGQAGQAIAWPLFGRSLGKGRQECSCACAMEVYSSSWCNSWTVCKWFIALHTNYSSSLIVIGCEPDHHIFASYGPVLATWKDCCASSRSVTVLVVAWTIIILLYWLFVWTFLWQTEKRNWTKNISVCWSWWECSSYGSWMATGGQQTQIQPDSLAMMMWCYNLVSKS